MKVAILALALTVLIPASLAKGFFGNIFEGATFYANKNYSAEVQTSIDSLKNTNLSYLIPKAKIVQHTQTGYWLDSHLKIPTIPGVLHDAARFQRKTKKPTTTLFVIYDLPNRDCSAGASAGEYLVADNGLAHYKAYIDGIAEHFAAFPNVRIAAIIEPDSIGNIVTNLDIPKCAEAEDDYKAGIAYAVQKLQFPHVSLYIDLAHGGWLGWAGNQAPTVAVVQEILALAAPGTVRGFSTDVSNYNAYNTTHFDPITMWSPTPDEYLYTQVMGALFQNVSIDAHFVVDVGRSGREDIRNTWGDWCNILDAGFGMLPTTKTNASNVDALLWVKPPGESDGTSNSSAPRFDPNCANNDSTPGAPEGGDWFNQYFINLLLNAAF